MLLDAIETLQGKSCFLLSLYFSLFILILAKGVRYNRTKNRLTTQWRKSLAHVRKDSDQILGRWVRPKYPYIA